MLSPIIYVMRKEPMENSDSNVMSRAKSMSSTTLRNKEVHSDFLAAEDKVSHIFKHSNTDKLCHKAMEILVSTYGSEAGCAALKLLPYGGVYIAGTIAFK
eukprot:Awhi_evm1s13745